MDVLPDEVVRVRPVLAVGLIGALMQGGEFDGVEARLRDVEQLLAKPPTAGMVVVDEPEIRRLPGTIQMYRAALALVARRRIGHDRATPGWRSTGRRPTITSPGPGRRPCSGLAAWGDGDLEAAHRAYSVAATGCGGSGTSPTSWAARSRWPTSA